MRAQSGIRPAPTQSAWFLGQKGADTVGILATELFERLRRNAENTFQRPFSHYVPWMSNPERLSAFAELAKSPNVALDPVLTDAKTLSVFREAYRTSPTAPLGYLTDERHWCLDLFEGTPEESSRVTEIFLKAKRNVISASPAFRDRFAVLHQTILPLTVPKNLSTGRAAFSTHEARGAIFMELPDVTVPFWDLILEIDIAHELGHTALIIYQATDPILESELGQPVFSAIRKTDRPAIMSFHAAAALAFMIEYLEATLAIGRHAGAALRFVEAELATYRKEQRVGLAALADCHFTPLGKLIYGEFVALSEGNLS